MKLAETQTRHIVNFCTMHTDGDCVSKAAQIVISQTYGTSRKLRCLSH